MINVSLVVLENQSQSNSRLFTEMVVSDTQPGQFLEQKSYLIHHEKDRHSSKQPGLKKGKVMHLDDARRLLAWPVLIKLSMRRIHQRIDALIGFSVHNKLQSRE